MENNEYVKNALNTEPADYNPIIGRMCDPAILKELLECFYNMRKVGERLDKVKRAIFYGKEHNYDTTHDCGYPEEKLINSQLAHIAGHKIDKRFARLVHAGLGLSTEAAEFIEALDDYIDGEGLDSINLSEEVGDIMWYSAIASDELKVPLSDIQETNINKLRARFPDRFTEEDALNRDLNKERDVLES